MSVPVLVDGYNLLYARGDTPSAATRQRLVRDLVRWAVARGRQVVIVFDAWAQGERTERQDCRGPVTVCFTRVGERADDWLVRRVSAQPEAVVVTSDRAVRQSVLRRGAAVVDSARFADRLEAPPEPAGRAATADEVTIDKDAAAEERRPPRGRGRHARWLSGL